MLFFFQTPGGKKIQLYFFPKNRLHATHQTFLNELILKKWGKAIFFQKCNLLAHFTLYFFPRSVIFIFVFFFPEND